MDKTFRLKIITPDETIFDEDIVSLVAPGAQGSLGVLAGHAPLVTPLSKGRITVKSPAKPIRHFDVEKGFLEVSGNAAHILAEKVLT